MLKAVLILSAAALLAACHAELPTAEDASHGRYAGVGTFDPGKLWKEMQVSPSQEAAVAKLDDDEHIIVVVDTHTGEVRQCGDHSGYCIAMNPWQAQHAMLPVKLKKHAAEIEADGKAGLSVSAPAH